MYCPDCGEDHLPGQCLKTEAPIESTVESAETVIESPETLTEPIGASTPDPQVVIDKSNKNRAGFWIRMLGKSIDTVVIIFLSGFVGSVIGIVAGLGISLPITIPMSFFLLNAFYWIWFEGITGRSLGKRVFGMVVVPIEDTHLTLAQTALRFVGMCVCDLLLGLPYLMIIGRNRMALHDRMSRTIVIRERF